MVLMVLRRTPKCLSRPVSDRRQRILKLEILFESVLVVLSAVLESHSRLPVEL